MMKRSKRLQTIVDIKARQEQAALEILGTVATATHRNEKDKLKV
jgi:hypothetical protein